MISTSELESWSVSGKNGFSSDISRNSNSSLSKTTAVKSGSELTFIPLQDSQPEDSPLLFFTLAWILPSRSPSTTFFAQKCVSTLKSIVVGSIYHFCAALTENIAVRLHRLFSKSANNVISKFCRIRSKTYMAVKKHSMWEPEVSSLILSSIENYRRLSFKDRTLEFDGLYLDYFESQLFCGKHIERMWSQSKLSLRLSKVKDKWLGFQDRKKIWLFQLGSIVLAKTSIDRFWPQRRFGTWYVNVLPWTFCSNSENVLAVTYVQTLSSNKIRSRNRFLKNPKKKFRVST